MEDVTLSFCYTSGTQIFQQNTHKFDESVFRGLDLDHWKPRYS
jgi:hypothetical protein